MRLSFCVTCFSQLQGNGGIGADRRGVLLRNFFRIVLPVHRSALATLTILTALSAWNEFFWPFLVGRSESVRVMAVAINAFRQQQAGGTPDWSGLMACTVLGIVPIAVLVVFFGRKVVESFQYSGPK